MDDAPEDQGEYGLGPRRVAAILEAAERGDRGEVVALVAPLHPADLADLLEQIAPPDRERLVRALGPDLDGEVLSELDEGLREEVIGALDAEALAGAIRDLDSDDVVDLIETLEEPRRAAILEALERRDRYAVERALTYPEESAGRLMQREVTAVPEHFTVGQAIDWLREHDDLPEQFYHLILVDPAWRPTGYVSLGRVLSARRDVALRDIREESFRVIPAAQDEEEVAYAFNQYHLISAPVVGEDGRLVGVITIDDAMAVLSEENEEDLRRLAGVGDESLHDRTLEIVRLRAPWLAVNLVTAILASLVISIFEDVIAAVVALAVLMPIVASMGGNAGTQSLTVAVRALATKDLTGSNMWRVLRREIMASAINGLVFAVVIGAVGVVWFGSLDLGLVIAAAMVINLAVAGLAGFMVPVALDRLGFDPALASGTFVTTVTDVVGFFAFLGLAAVVLL